MEKIARKPVDRQATFDTDPHRANLAHGNLKLPVIEAQEQEKRKSELKEKKRSDNSSSNNAENNTVNNSKKGTPEKDISTTLGTVKISESDRKTNILSNINKRVVNGTDIESKEVRNSKDASLKSTDEIGKNTRKTNGVLKSEQKADVSIKAIDTIKVSPQNKANETKNATGNSKPETSQKTNNNSNKPSQQIHKNVKESAVESKSKVNESRSRSPEKQQQPSKAAVLKDLNRKRSISPEKGRNSSPQKESNQNNIDKRTETKNQTVKTVVTKSPQNKIQSLNSEKDTNASPQKDSNPNNVDKRTGSKNQAVKTVVTKSPQNKAKTNVDEYSQKPSPRKLSNAGKSKVVQHQLENNSPSNKFDNKLNQSGVAKDTKNSSKNALLVNNAPAETHLPESGKIDKKSVNVSPRFPNEKQPSSTDQNKKQNDNKHLTNEDAKLKQNEPAIHKPDLIVNAVTSHLNNIQVDGNQSEPRKEETIEQKREKRNPDADYSQVASGQTVEKLRNSSERVLNASVQSKNETYVLSPSPTKFDSRSQRSNKVSRPGRLSPSNESVEPIKLEQRPVPDKPGMDIDRKESYSQVYAERNTLLNAEYTYRKRIKQLEEEANGFLKAIDELTTENKYLRGRVDSLEDELRRKGELHASDKISELEKDKAELENKIKQLEKSSSQSNNTTDELRELKEQIVKLQSENQTINEENLKLKSENYENTKKIHAMEAEKKSLETSVTDVKSEKVNKIQDLSNEQKHMNKQLLELKNKNKGLEKKVDALEYENKTLSETLAQKKSELGELLGVMKDENKFDDEIKDLKNEILKLNKEKKESELAHNKEKRILNEKLKDVKTSLETKSKYVDELKIKLDQVESEHKKIKSDFDPMKKLADSQKKEIARLKEGNERLKQELKESKEAYSRLGNETQSASKDLKEAKEQLETFNKELQKIVTDKESQISKLINQLDTMRQEREDERKSSKEEKEQLSAEIEKVESYQATTRRLEADLKHFSEKLDESKLKEKQLSLQLEDRSFEVSNLEQQVFEMNMKMENYSKRMSELDREKREMEMEKREWEVKKDKIDDIEASNKRLLEENKRLRNQIEMSSYASTYRSSERTTEEKPVVEAWVSEKGHSHAINHAIYVQKEKVRDHRNKKVHLAQPSIQKKRMPFSKSSPVKVSRQHKQDEHKSSNPSTHRSLEDLRKVGNHQSPESENSLPELHQDARLTVGYGSFGGYREIHKNRIRAAHKRVY